MPLSYLIMDIETVPDAALYTPPETQNGVERPFPPLYAHRPVAIGALWLDHEYRFKRIGCIGEARIGACVDESENEKGMLEDFSAFVGKYRPELVTYNGRGFDLPVLALRSLRHGVSMGWYYQGRTRHRYSEDGHLDLCDMLTDHGAARAMSLDAMARLIGLPGKIGVDGSQVEGLYRAGKIDLVRNYCLADVAQTALLFLRFRVLQGVLDRDRYRAAAAELMDALRADPRLDTLTSAIDGERLLLAAA